MSSLQLFQYAGREIRTVEIDGIPWIVLADIAKLLGYRDANTAARILRDHHKGYAEVRTPGGEQQMMVITEQGFNRLVIRSNASNAEAVQDWVTDEVLPQIRRTGSYGTPALDLNALDPRTLALAILEESDRADAAEKQLAIVAPKAEAFQHFIESDGSLPMGAVANMFKVGRQTLFDWLKLAKIIQADRRPYQEFAHWFEVKATTFERSSGMSGVSYSSKLLPSGVDPLYKLLVRRDYIKPEATA